MGISRERPATEGGRAILCLPGKEHHQGSVVRPAPSCRSGDQRGRPLWRQLEHRSAAMRTVFAGRAEKAATRVNDQSTDGIAAIPAGSEAAEIVEYRQVAIAPAPD